MGDKTGKNEKSPNDPILKYAWSMITSREIKNTLVQYDEMISNDKQTINRLNEYIDLLKSQVEGYESLVNSLSEQNRLLAEELENLKKKIDELANDPPRQNGFFEKLRNIRDALRR